MVCQLKVSSLLRYLGTYRVIGLAFIVGIFFNGPGSVTDTTGDLAAD